MTACCCRLTHPEKSRKKKASGRGNGSIAKSAPEGWRFKELISWGVDWAEVPEAQASSDFVDPLIIGSSAFGGVFAQDGDNDPVICVKWLDEYAVDCLSDGLDDDAMVEKDFERPPSRDSQRDLRRCGLRNCQRGPGRAERENKLSRTKFFAAWRSGILHRHCSWHHRYGGASPVVPVQCQLLRKNRFSAASWARDRIADAISATRSRAT
jgi:hypothetical protein